MSVAPAPRHPQRRKLLFGKPGDSIVEIIYLIAILPRRQSAIQSLPQSMLDQRALLCGHRLLRRPMPSVVHTDQARVAAPMRPSCEPLPPMTAALKHYRSRRPDAGACPPSPRWLARTTRSFFAELSANERTSLERILRKVIGNRGLATLPVN